MICPRCHAGLAPQTRVGVVVDVCERCAGFWMDRQEVLKMATELHALQRDARRPRPPHPLSTSPCCVSGAGSPPGIASSKYSRCPPSKGECVLCATPRSASCTGFTTRGRLERPHG